MRVFFVIILTLSIFKTSAQVIKIADVKQEPLDISARENKVTDANGDGCALIKTRTGLDNLSFYSDLGINKIEKRDGEFWLWVPSGTQRITIITPDKDTTAFSLPGYAQEFNVYIAFLTAIIPDSTEYRDLPLIRIKTKPEKSDVFINNLFQGKSPLAINVPPDSFNIRIEKKRYSPLTLNDSTGFDNKEYILKLDKDPFASRISISVMSSLVYTGKLNLGVNIGIFSKPGIYFSLMLPVNKIKDYVGVNTDLTNFNYSDFYLGNYDGGNVVTEHSEIILGLNSYINEFIILYAGVGMVRSYTFKEFYKYSYHDDLTPVGTTWGKINDFNISRGMGLDLGLTFRVQNKYLINIFQTTIFARADRKVKYRLSNLKLGLGYNF